jgi:hypothetical protein
MAGKKYGLDDKYKALGVGQRNISINPMQDDLEKLKGMAGAIGAPSKFVTRSMALSTGAKRAGQSTGKMGSVARANLDAIKNSKFAQRSLKIRASNSSKTPTQILKETIMSKPSIGAAGLGAGWEARRQVEKNPETLGNRSIKEIVTGKKRYGGAMKKMRIGGAAVKGKGAVVGGSGLQDEKLKPGKNYKVKK